MFHKALLLLLPTVAYAQIKILIKSPDSLIDSPSNSFTILLSGDTDTVVSDTDRQIWNITDDQVKDMGERCYWVKQRPCDVYVRSPTPWGDKYKILNATDDNNNKTDENNNKTDDNNNRSDNNNTTDELIEKKTLEEVRRHLHGTIRNYKRISYERVIVKTYRFYNYNNFTVEYRKYGYGISNNHYVDETVAATWHTGGDIKLNISYELNLHGWNAPDVSFTGSWGKNVKKAKSVRILVPSSQIQCNVTTVEPGEKVIADLYASRATLEFQVDITASLTGGMVLHYANKINGLQDYYPDINDFLNECNRSTTVLSDVWFKIVFYADPHIIVTKDTPPVRHNVNSDSKRIHFS